MKSVVVDRLTKEFGSPSREVVKVKSWDLSGTMGLVLQMDQPNREDAAYVWLPYPGEGQTVPEIALEYPGEAGRHSGTYPVPGLKRGEPALKLIIRNAGELDDVIGYILAMLSSGALPQVRARPEIKRQQPVCGAYGDAEASENASLIDPASMPRAESVKPRREAIPRLVQREVWQRDGGRCVECFARERLCFDHIVPFSKGGGNSVRNLQLLCEPCNLSKSNRI
jgi:5-methylcytosine-specific restriction endonuclease McrA